MSAVLENFEARMGHLPGGPEDTAQAEPKKKGHRLDDEKARKRGNQLWDWYEQERIKQSANRIEQAIDADFHDNLQWSEADAEEIRDRGQAPCVFNKGREKVEWLTGTERRTRVDHKILPRKGGELALKDASVKTKLMKYISDTSHAEFARSRAFADAVKVGIGWIEEGVRADPTEEAVYSRYESWRNVWWDSCGTELDTSDWRYLFREKTVDLDVALAMFPDRASVVKEGAITADIFDQDQDDFYYFGQRVGSSETEFRTAGHRVYIGDTFSANNRRERVKLIEGWYRVPVARKIMHGDVFDKQTYDPGNPAHVRAVKEEAVSLFDAVVMEVRCAMMIRGGKLLQDVRSPFKHNRFPFIPIWCFRRDRDGMPYGVWRIMRDPQEDLNKRMSKALFMLSSRQVIMEEGAVEDEDILREEAARPDGVIVKRRNRELTLRDQPELAEEHLKLAEMDMQFMESGSAVTNELLAQQSNAVSGKAIVARQTQGAVVTAPVFDNLRLAIQLSGEVRLCNIEQYMTAEQMIRVVGPKGKPDFIVINEQGQDERGQPTILNDITAFQADFVVSEEDFSETIRLALFEQLMDMITKLPPEMVPQLLDVVLELAPVPGVEEIVRRIRTLNGQTDPDAEPTPEEIAAAQAKQQKMAEAEAIERQGKLAEIQKNEAQAQNFHAQAELALAKAGEVGMQMPNVQAEIDARVHDIQAKYDASLAKFADQVRDIRTAAANKQQEIAVKHAAQLEEARLKTESAERINKYNADRQRESAAAQTRADKDVALADRKHQLEVKDLKRQLAEVTRQVKAAAKAKAKPAQPKSRKPQ